MAEPSPSTTVFPLSVEFYHVPHSFICLRR